jgi:para-nitrobenzyl esterase
MRPLRELETHMHTSHGCASLVGLALLLAGWGTMAQTTPQGKSPLAGTSWQLVRFQGSDEKILTPDDRAEYTIEFGKDGTVAARIDCNRGRGTWNASAPSQLELGPLALTRAMCPPGSLHDQIVKHWSYVRSYVVRDGHPFLSLMADGGIYKFEPVTE